MKRKEKKWSFNIQTFLKRITFSKVFEKVSVSEKIKYQHSTPVRTRISNLKDIFFSSQKSKKIIGTEQKEKFLPIKESSKDEYIAKKNSHSLLTYKANEIILRNSPYTHYFRSLLSAERLVENKEYETALELYYRLLNKILSKNIRNKIEQNIKDIESFLKSTEKSGKEKKEKISYPDSTISNKERRGHEDTAKKEHVSYQESTKALPNVIIQATGGELIIKRGTLESKKIEIQASGDANVENTSSVSSGDGSIQNGWRVPPDDKKKQITVTDQPVSGSGVHSVSSGDGSIQYGWRVPPDDKKKQITVTDQPVSGSGVHSVSSGDGSIQYGSAVPLDDKKKQITVTNQPVSGLGVHSVSSGDGSIQYGSAVPLDDKKKQITETDQSISGSGVHSVSSGDGSIQYGSAVPLDDKKKQITETDQSISGSGVHSVSSGDGSIQQGSPVPLDEKKKQRTETDQSALGGGVHSVSSGDGLIQQGSSPVPLDEKKKQRTETDQSVSSRDLFVPPFTELDERGTRMTGQFGQYETGALKTKPEDQKSKSIDKTETSKELEKPEQAEKEYQSFDSESPKVSATLEVKEEEDSPFLILTYDFTKIPYPFSLSKDNQLLEYAYYKYKPMLIKAQKYVNLKQISKALDYYQIIIDQDIPTEMKKMVDQNAKDITKYINNFLHVSSK